MTFTYIDLFAGCGGLSLGLERAGFELELAVEKSDMAAETFYHNFIERIQDLDRWKTFASEDTHVEEQAAKKLIVKELRALLDSEKIVDDLKNKEIDLIAGGPPCQGFSLAGRRNPEDARNQLPWQFLELVREVQPKAVIIENVSGITQNFIKHNKEAPFEQLRIALTEIGYLVQPVMINAMHFGAPQHRPRAMLIGVRKDISDALNLKAYSETWKSDYDNFEISPFDERPDLAPQATHFGDDILTVRDALWDLNDKGYTHTLINQKYQKARSAFAKNIREDIKWMSHNVSKINRDSNLKNHILRNHADHIKQRFRVYQYLQKEKVPLKILGIAKQSRTTNRAAKVAIKEALAEAKFPAVSPDKTVIAKHSEDLADIIIELATKKHSQRPLQLDQPSPTIVSLPDDYVHPLVPRTMTVREMARFQSFPDTFEFRAKETTGSMRRRFEVPQYTQVGNAVPPVMAEAVGKKIFKILNSFTSISSEGKQKRVVNS